MLCSSMQVQLVLISILFVLERHVSISERIPSLSMDNPAGFLASLADLLPGQTLQKRQTIKLA